jgi:hypothetical protein
LHNNDILRLFSRLSASGEGIELKEYLQELSSINYEAFKNDNPQYNEMHKGYGIAIDSLIKLLDSAVDILANQEKNQKLDVSEHY